MAFTFQLLTIIPVPGSRCRICPCSIASTRGKHFSWAGFSRSLYPWTYCWGRYVQSSTSNAVDSPHVRGRHSQCRVLLCVVASYSWARPLTTGHSSGTARNSFSQQLVMFFYIGYLPGRLVFAGLSWSCTIHKSNPLHPDLTEFFLRRKLSKSMTCFMLATGLCSGSALCHLICTDWFIYGSSEQCTVGAAAAPDQRSIGWEPYTQDMEAQWSHRTNNC